MKQSIKIDIIYFGVERDTKMEFCFNDYEKMPIRTLATAVNEREEFLYALKRAVYRSDTVIVVGGLSGNVYIPGIIGAAIGVPSEKVDYPALGFAEPARPLMFPKGSIPLVTPDNHIGGMLLEKGKQSIIVLDGNSEIRHQLLEGLIYPYIFDLGNEEQPENYELQVSEQELEEETEIEEEVMDEIDETEPTDIETEENDIIESAPVITEEVVVNQLPNVSDGMFVIADDGSGEEDPEGEEIESESVSDDFDYTTSVLNETTLYAGYQEPDEDDSGYYDDDYYTPSVSVGKVLGIIFALLCIGASATIFTMFFMGLL